jgi:PAS domain-containing protein
MLCAAEAVPANGVDVGEALPENGELCMAGVDVGRVAIVLDGLPPRLYAAWEQQSDALLREYALVAGAEHPFSLADIGRARNARLSIERVPANMEGGATTDAAGSRMSVTLNTVVRASDFSTLQAVLEEADALARDADFLTLPSLPEIVALRNWVCGQVVTQAAGATSTAWALHADPLPVRDIPLAAWSGAEELPADGAWLVGDVHNRIISCSARAASLLHWPQDGLVGQRIIAVIPPALREAHVAAFTEASLTGVHTLLGRPLEVAAWSRDGHEIPITLTLDRRRGEHGRAVYVATLEERPPGDEWARDD